MVLLVSVWSAESLESLLPCDMVLQDSVYTYTMFLFLYAWGEEGNAGRLH